MNFGVRRIIRYYYIRIKRLQGDPRQLALGCAIGVLIGISPTLPLHTVMIIGITVLLRTSTIAALVAATVVSNPLTLVPQYYLCWRVGDWVLPGRLSWKRMQEELELLMHSSFSESLKSISLLGVDAVLVMLVGGLIIGIPLAVISYFPALHFFIKIHNKRKKKHLLC